MSSGVAKTLAEKWNGTQWSISTSSNVGSSDNYLNAVASSSSTDGWAVGYYINNSGVAQTLIDRTTDSGATWNTFSSPNQGTHNNYLNSVTKVPSGSGDMWAVGYYINNSGVAQPLTMKYDHNTNSWGIQVTEVVLNSGDNFFRGVRAIDSSRVWAVGDYINNSSVSRTLAEQWNGTKWTTSLPLNSNTTDQNYLYGVSLLGATNRTWAIGYTRDASGKLKTLAEYYYGGWNMTSPINPSTTESVFFATEDIVGGAGVTKPQECSPAGMRVLR